VKLAAWRISKRKHARTAFSGKGASDYGGRWNSPGIPVIYLSQSQALAALEMLVHLDSAELLQKYVLIEAGFDSSLVEELDWARLPRNWRAASSDLRVLGDAWLAARTSAVLRVPSALVPSETNYLVNPRHPDFPQIEIGKPLDFGFDPRLSK
jgi:RES domain-containing protein